MRVPSSTPGGMVTLRVLSWRLRPWPPQDRQGLSMILPAPWQPAQVVSTVKKPWEWRTLPLPRQVGQLTGLEPFSAPLARLLAAPSAHELAEHLLEDVGEAAAGGEVEARRMGTAAMAVREGPV